MFRFVVVEVVDVVVVVVVVVVEVNGIPLDDEDGGGENNILDEGAEMFVFL